MTKDNGGHVFVPIATKYIWHQELMMN